MDKLQPGDACVDCLNQGQNHKLRYFYINLEEQLLKCESRSCLWPHNDEVSSDEDENVNLVEQSNNEDDDFIMQLLNRLSPEQESCDVLPAASSSSVPESTYNIEDILSLPNLGDYNALESQQSEQQLLSRPKAENASMSVPFHCKESDKDSNLNESSTTDTPSNVDIISFPNLCNFDVDSQDQQQTGLTLSSPIKNDSNLTASSRNMPNLFDFDIVLGQDIPSTPNADDCQGNVSFPSVSPDKKRSNSKEPNLLLDVYETFKYQDGNNPTVVPFGAVSSNKKIPNIKKTSQTEETFKETSQTEGTVKETSQTEGTAKPTSINLPNLCYLETIAGEDQHGVPIQFVSPTEKVSPEPSEAVALNIPALPDLCNFEPNKSLDGEIIPFHAVSPIKTEPGAMKSLTNPCLPNQDQHSSSKAVKNSKSVLFHCIPTSKNAPDVKESTACFGFELMKASTNTKSTLSPKLELLPPKSPTPNVLFSAKAKILKTSSPKKASLTRTPPKPAPNTNESPAPQSGNLSNFLDALKREPVKLPAMHKTQQSRAPRNSLKLRRNDAVSSLPGAAAGASQVRATLVKEILNRISSGQAQCTTKSEP